MRAIRISGGRSLQGKVRVSGAKNAVLPVMAASLLAPGASTISNVPQLADVNTMALLLGSLGCHVKQRSASVTVDAGKLATHRAPYHLVRRMRASILVMGPLLARLGKAQVPLPGGCAIGIRPIDLHLKGFAALGADIVLGHGFVEAEIGGRKRLLGASIYLDYPSVGATESIMMAASLAEGLTQIENAAREPEIVDLANMLNSMGAHVSGAGTDCIRIIGVRELKSAQYSVIPDRIETGTYMVAAAITGGEIAVENALPDHVRPIIAKLREAGVIVNENEAGMVVRSTGLIKAVDVKTLPYPGFPTDMQPQVMALLTLAQGTSVVTETVFENRFMHVDELLRMGANIRIDGRTAIIKGVPRLYGTGVKATDLRAGAALILAGLAASGETLVAGVRHIDRGYENLVGKLSNLGADIQVCDL